MDSPFVLLFLMCALPVFIFLGWGFFCYNLGRSGWGVRVTRGQERAETEQAVSYATRRPAGEGSRLRQYSERRET